MAEINHAARDHATWSASASDRRWACPGSLALEMRAPADVESEAAAWGTACHEVAEWTLRRGADVECVFFPGVTVKTKQHEIEVTDEITETAQVYVDYVRGAAGGKTLLVEQKFSLDSLGTPFEAGGTGDAVILDDKAGQIEIVDLKGGRGVVVEALGNKQLRTYALGALMANPGPWQTVKVTIVQPRAPHPDGRIRSETFSVAELVEWTQDLLAAMAKAEDARVGQARLPMEPWAEKYLTAGAHCTFCKAAPTCPALAKKSMDEAHTFFAPQVETKVPPAPEMLTMDQIVRVLDHADMIGNWLNAVRAFAQRQAEAGQDVTDGESTYVLTPKRATRKWKDEEQVVTAMALRTDRNPEDFYQDPKIMSPAMVEKLLGKKGYATVEDLVVKESSGFNLTRLDKTTREIATPVVKQLFAPQA